MYWGVNLSKKILLIVFKQGKDESNINEKFIKKYKENSD